jgi:hypothetical protein
MTQTHGRRSLNRGGRVAELQQIPRFGSSRPRKQADSGDIHTRTVPRVQCRVRSRFIIPENPFKIGRFRLKSAFPAN